MTFKTCVIPVLTALALSWPAGATQAETVGNSSRTGPPPAAMKLDPFYRQALQADGLWVVASSRVRSETLYRTAGLIAGMLAYRPALAPELSRMGIRVAIMARSESTMDLPEQRNWHKPAPDDQRLTFCERKEYATRIAPLTDSQYWAGRARGMGGKLTSGAEENILGLDGDRYHGENIFVHEFSHSIYRALSAVDPALHQAVGRAYAAAREKGLWKGDYAENTVDEYWAEGTQFWFNTNRIAFIGDLAIRNDADFIAHDPALAAIMAKVYGPRHHLAGDVFWDFNRTHPEAAPVRSPGSLGC